MEYVIFSDVHGNSYVLRELLKREGSSTNKRFIFCGDICGYYYDAEECIRLLERIPDLITVRGNHDQYYLEAYDNNDMTERLVQKYGSSYRSKNENIYSYIEKMPVSMDIEIRGREVYIQHGSNLDPIEGRVYPDAKLDNLRNDAVYIAGHTHYQMFKRVNNTLWINPGSLGQPRDGKGFVYCVMDENFNVVYHRIDINISPLIQKVKLKDSENKYLEEVLYRNL